MKTLFVLLCAAGALSLAGCGNDPTKNPAPAEEALAQAKKEALDAANEAVALKIHVQTNQTKIESDQTSLDNAKVLESLYANADSALRQAKAANSVEEANQAKALAEETRRRLQNLSDIIGIFRGEEEPDTPQDF